MGKNKFKVWVHIEEMYYDENGEEQHRDIDEECRMLREFDSVEDANQYIVELYEEQKFN
jgi:hypothetical protein